MMADDSVYSLHGLLDSAAISIRSPLTLVQAVFYLSLSVIDATVRVCMQIYDALEVALRFEISIVY